MQRVCVKVRWIGWQMASLSPSVLTVSVTWATFPGSPSERGEAAELTAQLSEGLAEACDVQ